MKMLWDPPTEIQASGFRSAARRFGWIAERCSAARVRFVAANHAAPLPPARRFRPAVTFATGGSIREPDATRFLRLMKDERPGCS